MLWVKAFHIISMVAWFAGIFYLPRLYVYHAASTDEISNIRFQTMERRLFYGIMTPAALLTIVLGLWLTFGYAWQAYKSQMWLHIKFTLVFLLIIYHGYCWKLLKQFKANNNQHSPLFYKILNEIPVLLLIAIVVLAVVKPF